MYMVKRWDGEEPDGCEEYVEPKSINRIHKNVSHLCTVIEAECVRNNTHVAYLEEKKTDAKNLVQSHKSAHKTHTHRDSCGITIIFLLNQATNQTKNDEN